MTVVQTDMASPPPPDQAADDAQHCRRVLMDLMDMAHGVARVMHRHVTAPAEAAPQPVAGGEPPVPAISPLAAAASFDRAARNIRQTVLLVGQVGRPNSPVARPGLHRIAARKRIIRGVEDVIQRTAAGPRAERLYAELAERLDAPDLEEELDYRQVAEIVTDLCRDLGLAHTEGTHPWKRRTPADIAALRARAARPPGAAPEGLPVSAAGAWTGVGPAGGPAWDDPSDRPVGAVAGGLVAAGLRGPGMHDDAWDAEAPDDDGSGDDEGLPPAPPDAAPPDAAPPDAAPPDAAPPDAALSNPALPDADLPDPEVYAERADDVCDYQPRARSWGAADPLIPRRAVLDVNRPRGRASFRGG